MTFKTLCHRETEMSKFVVQLDPTKAIFVEASGFKDAQGGLMFHDEMGNIIAQFREWSCWYLDEDQRAPCATVRNVLMPEPPASAAYVDGTALFTWKEVHEYGLAVRDACIASLRDG